MYNVFSLFSEFLNQFYHVVSSFFRILQLRETERDTHRERERERDRQRKRERETERETERDRERETERERGLVQLEVKNIVLVVAFPVSDVILMLRRREEGGTGASEGNTFTTASFVPPDREESETLDIHSARLAYLVCRIISWKREEIFQQAHISISSFN